jgi:hypothetical protein
MFVPGRTNSNQTHLSATKAPPTACRNTPLRYRNRASPRAAQQGAFARPPSELGCCKVASTRTGGRPQAILIERLVRIRRGEPGSHGRERALGDEPSAALAREGDFEPAADRRRVGAAAVGLGARAATSDYADRGRSPVIVGTIVAVQCAPAIARNRRGCDSRFRNKAAISRVAARQIFHRSIANFAMRFCRSSIAVSFHSGTIASSRSQ